jgi:hypothetical protein
VNRSSKIVREVLDVLEVTDSVYHHLAYTRPMVEVLVTEVGRIAPAGRVLIIGPNELLPAVLIKLGYEVDLWVLDGLPLSDELRRRASRSGTVDEVVDSVGPPVDIVVVPYTVEAASLEPSALLTRLAGNLSEEGWMVVASRQPGELRRRLRARGWAGYEGILPPSPTWPALPLRRLLTARTLAGAVAGNFRVVRARLVIDHREYLAVEALSVFRWLKRKLAHLVKLAVPQFRDCVVVTMVRSG